MIRNRASGFRSVDAFIDLIYLVTGDVAHIPRMLSSPARSFPDHEKRRWVMVPASRGGWREGLAWHRGARVLPCVGV
jgi:hypothetical protein